MSSTRLLAVPPIRDAALMLTQSVRRGRKKTVSNGDVDKNSHRCQPWLQTHEMTIGTRCHDLMIYYDSNVFTMAVLSGIRDQLNACTGH